MNKESSMPFDLTGRMVTFGLDATATDLIRAHEARLLPHVGDVVDAYYAHLARGEFAALMRPDALADLKAMRVVHWRLMLNADFAAIRDHYLHRLGPRLVDGGFPRTIFVVAAEWFVLAFGELVDADRTLDEAERRALRRVLTRIAFFDLALSDGSRDLAWID